MLTSTTLENLLDRLRQMTRNGVGEAVAALTSDQIALVPWEGMGPAIETATVHAVAFANQMGGDLVFGIDATGAIHGCPDFEAERLAQAILARTRPGIVAECWRHETQEGVLGVVSIPADSGTYAISDGRRLRRVGGANVPIMPHQDAVVAADRAADDFTARSLNGLALGDLDPMQLIYLREIVRRNNDQSELLELDDVGLLQALGIVDSKNVPRTAALILLGSRKALREHLPQAEVVYIHVDERDEPDAQEHLHLPLLHALSRLQDLIEARNRFVTLKQGLFHFKVKDFDEDVYREALVNALVHRDYARRDGAVHVVHSADRLEIANPGGFIGGVSTDNILYHPPRHRNRCLTEALQQLGLMERAGAGVNRIYRFLLRKGKPIPHYEATPHSVRLTLYAGRIDEAFAQFIAQEESHGRLFSLDMLIVLSSLTRTRAMTAREAAQYAQRPERSMLGTLNKMIRWGYLERVGAGRATTYRLTERVYGQLGDKITYFRDRGLSERGRRALVIEVAQELGGLTNQQCQELCSIDQAEASRLLKSLVEQGSLEYDRGKYRPC